MRYFIGTMGVFTASLSACIPPHNTVLPTPAEIGPAHFPSHIPAQRTPTKVQKAPWWQSGVSPALSDIIQQAVTHTPDVTIAQKRQMRALAALDQSSRRFAPTLDVNTRATALFEEDTPRSETIRLGATGHLTLDPFGAQKAYHTAALADVSVANAQLDDTRLKSAASAATFFISASAAALRQSLLVRQITTSQTLLALTQLRFTQGQSSIVAVLQQRDQLLSLKQQHIRTESERREATNTLATLLGHPLPDATIDATQIPAIPPPRLFPQPAQLLLTRPDLRVWQARLEAADHRFAGALRARLPNADLSITGTSLHLHELTSKTLTSVLGSALTLFDSGKATAITTARRAELEETGSAYIKAYLEAVAQVDSLHAKLGGLEREAQAATQRLSTAENLLQAAQTRYKSGASDYLPVLNALQNLQAQERALLTLQAQVARTRVALHTALGDAGISS